MLSFRFGFRRLEVRFEGLGVGKLLLVGGWCFGSLFFFKISSLSYFYCFPTWIGSELGWGWRLLRLSFKLSIVESEGNLDPGLDPALILNLGFSLLYT
jgi:hypothetical protein